MKSFPSTIQIKQASSRRSRQDLSYTHYTTMDFFQIIPSACLETVPNDKFTFSINNFVRLAPLALPTFGKMKLHHRAFFVPYRDVCAGFDEFINRDRYPSSSGSYVTIPSVPVVTNSILANWIVSPVKTGNGQPHTTNLTEPVQIDDQIIADGSSSLPSEIVNGTQKCDIVYVWFTDNQAPTETSIHYALRNLTNQGRRLMKVLQSLKMNVNFSEADTTPMSMLPLLCYMKVYLDWYYPSLFYDNEGFSKLFTNNVGKAYVASDLDWLYNILYTTYDADYFTKAWVRPISPNTTSSTASETIEFQDITNSKTSSFLKSNVFSSGTSSGLPTNSTPTIASSPSDSIVRNLSSYSLNALRALTNYMVRNHASGFRPLSRYLTRYGIRVSDDVLRRSRFLGSSETWIKTTDIMSTSDSGSSSVGDYAGAGAGASSSVLFKNERFKDFGMIIVVSTMIPHVGYTQGRDRMYQHLTPFDFYTPEFDKLGVQAIRCDEVFASGGFDSSYVQGIGSSGSAAICTPDNNARAWAYTPRYSEYKVSRDVLSGDFTVGTLNENLKPYHFMRNVLFADKFSEDPSSFGHGWIAPVYNQRFVTGSHEDYNRIFQVPSPAIDHFFCYFDISITGVRPMSSITDALDITDGSKDLSIPFGGIQVN